MGFPLTQKSVDRILQSRFAEVSALDMALFADMCDMRITVVPKRFIKDSEGK